MGPMYRVYNKCKHDIGLQLANNQQCNIIPDSFRLLSADDILFAESLCVRTKFFSQRMLIIVDPSTGKELTLEQIGGYTDESMPKHMSDDEIAAQLKQSAKKIEAWVATIQDASELHAIYEVAKSLDLPASKLRLLSEYMPEKDFLSE